MNNSPEQTSELSVPESSTGDAIASFDRAALSSDHFLTGLRKTADEVAAGEGCYIYDLEFVGLGGHRALRVYVEKESESGVSIDDCSNVSRRLSEILEANEELIPGGAYDLEVSSPGLERVLKEPRHFEKVIGKKIAVKSFAPLLQFNESVPELGLAKQIQGRLLSFDASGLKVEFRPEAKAKAATDSAPAVVFIPFDTVTKAHVVFEFIDPAAAKPGSKKKGAAKYGSGKSGKAQQSLAANEDTAADDAARGHS